MTVRCMIKVLMLGLILALLSGCAGLLARPVPPQVNIAAISLTDANLFEQRYHIKLRLQNPNDFDMPINGVQFQVQIQINGRPFASGMSSAPVSVPRFGTAVIEIDAISTLAEVARQLNDIVMGQTQGVRYTLTGKVHLARPAVELPFHQEGDMKLPSLEGKSSK